MADVIKMPKLGFDMAEGTLIRWVIGEGESVEKGQLLAEIETDKATVEIESQFTGTLRHHLVTEGAIVPISQAIAVVGEAKEKIDLDELIGKHNLEEESEPVQKENDQPADTSITSQAIAPAGQAPLSTKGSLPDGVKASPLARRMAKEKNIDLRSFSGSGPNGRIVKKDIENYVPGSAAALPAGIQLAGLPPLQMPDLAASKADERISLSRLRAAIGRRMTSSRQEVPHFYVTSEYDMAPVIAVRKQANAMLQANGEKLSLNDFVLKASALALRQFPNLNASLDGDAVIHKGQVNVGVAVAVENGLLVVVVKDADRKSIRMISREVKEMAVRARSGNVHLDDIEGSTFSLSNLGMFDVNHFVAIINPPEAAILALGSAREVPVVEKGQIVVGSRMQATLSVDHRVSDGAEGAKFMQALGQYLENPAALLLQ